MDGLGSTLLIANRGEIAIRIARTARRLGLDTVGVYSEPDRTALHVDHVDRAVALGGASPAESYLRPEAIVAAARATGSTAVHPGYGFLAENAEFAEAVIAAGLVWVGPTPDQIRLLGDKVAAKRAAVEAGVPTTPIIEVGSDGNALDDLDPESFPLLVKAAAGGGGRGMRVVHDPNGLAEAIEAATREAVSAFGDGTVFVEPFIERGRHVEVQIFGDSHGNVVHLGERECSIQRRNQKVVEEAPSPGISDTVRDQLHAGAVAIARHVGYLGAGTVEFMVSDAEGADDEPVIAFLEVNTRLQVEHPVTEAVTGFDLVEWQLAVANGEPLPVTQDDVSFDGHAIEVRLVAEDPADGWLPSTGTITAFGIDLHDRAIRVDAGYGAGSVVSADYDSLLAKVIAHSPDRVTAARRLARTLRSASITGVRTNAAVLATILGERDFLAGRTPTAYLDDHPEVLVAPGMSDGERDAHLLGAVVALEHERRDGDRVTGFAPSGWRNLRTRGQRRTLVHDGGGPHGTAPAPAPHTNRGEPHYVEYTIERGNSDEPTAARVLLGHWPIAREDGSLPDDERRVVVVRLLDRSSTHQVVEVDGVRWKIATDVHLDSHDAGGRIVTATSTSSAAWVVPPRFVDHDAVDAGSGPVSPLPGTVIAVHVAAGDSVSEGELLMVVEAMKMEHKIVAPADAVVADVPFSVGDRVDTGDLLVALESGDD